MNHTNAQPYLEHLKPASKHKRNQSPPPPHRLLPENPFIPPLSPRARDAQIHEYKNNHTRQRAVDPASTGRSGDEGEGKVDEAFGRVVGCDKVSEGRVGGQFVGHPATPATTATTTPITTTLGGRFGTSAAQRGKVGMAVVLHARGEEEEEGAEEGARSRGEEG